MILENAQDGLGCPAHAGIDLNPRYFLTSGLRLPRPRGDRPQQSIGVPNFVGVAPPTRG